MLEDHAANSEEEAFPYQYVCQWHVVIPCIRPHKGDM